MSWEVPAPGLSATAVSSSISSALSSAVSSAASITSSLSSAVGSGSATVVPKQLSGLILSNDVGTPNTVLDIAAGQATDGTDATSIVLASAFTKTTGAWVAATGNGGLDTGAVAASTWYYVWLISKAAGASPDILISLSASAPTMPSTYTLKRRIGAFKTNGSSNIIKFLQIGSEFMWDVPTQDINDATVSATTAQTKTLNVPPGITVTALFAFGATGGGTGYASVTSPLITDTAPGATLFGIYFGVSTIGAFRVKTSNGTVRYRQASATSDGVVNTTYGWIDDRGMGIF